MKLRTHTRKALWATLVLAMTIGALSGCSKEDSDSFTDDYYITFGIDGNAVTFSGTKVDLNVVGTFNILETGETDQYASGITAYSDDGGTIGILIGTRQPAAVNTIYTNYTVAEPKIKADTYIATLTHSPSANVIGSMNEEALSTVGMIADCEIIFTEVMDTYLKGQFSGTWYNFEEDDTGVGVKISNGEFKVARYDN